MDLEYGKLIDQENFSDQRIWRPLQKTKKSMRTNFFFCAGRPAGFGRGEDGRGPPRVQLRGGGHVLHGLKVGFFNALIFIL